MQDLSRTNQLISWTVKVSVKHLARKLKYLCKSSASTKSCFVSLALCTLTQFFFYAANSNLVSRSRSLIETFLLLTSEIKYNWIRSWTLSPWSRHALFRSTYQNYQTAVQLSERQYPLSPHFLLLPSLASPFVCWFPLPQHMLKSFLSLFILLTQWKTVFLRQVRDD